MDHPTLWCLSDMDFWYCMQVAKDVMWPYRMAGLVK